MASAVTGSSRQQQQPPAPLPTVVAAAMPSYPRIAELAGIAGIARLRVYTDGEKVQLSVVVQDSPMFAKGVQENLKTWRFAPHAPTSFEVAFRFKLIYRKNPDPCGPKRNDPWIGPDTVSTFRFPPEVEIESFSDSVSACDPTVTLFLSPVSEIRGVVVCDCEGRRPIADAEVIVGEDTVNSRDALRRARTDADGSFSIAATRWGTNELRVHKPGYFDRFYQVKFMPLPWYRPGDFELEIAPDAAADKPPPTKRAFLIPTTVPFYPRDAHENNVVGEVRLRIAPGGELTPVAGAATLLKPTLEMARTWKVNKGDEAAEIRFTYKLIDGDCLGGGPVVTFKGSHDVEVLAKRIVPCGAPAPRGVGVPGPQGP